MIISLLKINHHQNHRVFSLLQTRLFIRNTTLSTSMRITNYIYIAEHKYAFL